MHKLKARMLQIDRQLIASQGQIKEVSKSQEYQQLVQDLFKIYDMKQEEIIASKLSDDHYDVRSKEVSN